MFGDKREKCRTCRCPVGSVDMQRMSLGVKVERAVEEGGRIVGQKTSATSAFVSLGGKNKIGC